MGRSWRWFLLGAAVLAALATWAIVHGRTGPPPAPGPRATPVTTAAVARRDVPVYLQGLGSVVAFRTVTVKTQLDGRLDQVLFTEGQPVHRGQVLAQIDPRPYRIQLEQARGALARDEAQLKNARLNVERDRPLVAQKLIAPQQLDTDLAAAGQLEGAVQVDRAAIASAQLNLDYARITSPIDGVAGIRQVDPGNVVHATDPAGLVVVTQLDPVAILFTLPQDQLTPVATRLAGRRTLPVDVFSRDGLVRLGSGQLTLLDNQINPTTSTLRLKAVVPNPRRALWPNQFVNARLLLDTRRGALVMPLGALQRGPGGTFVYVVGPDLTAAARPVSIEDAVGDLAVIAGGLAEGEQVVTEGQNQLRPGARVAPHEAARGPAAPRVAADGDGAGGMGGGGAP